MRTTIDGGGAGMRAPSTGRRLAVITWGTVLALLLAALVAPPARGAATFTVTTTADTSDRCRTSACSLRAALLAANANPGADTVVVPAGRYMLGIAGTGEDAGATGDIDVTAAVTIVGAGRA